MKGIIFTELLELVESTYSFEMVDHIIGHSELASDGAYTAVGTYDAAELERLLSALSAATKIAEADLLQGFGRHLLGRFATLYPGFFAGCRSCFDFLPRVGDHIHVEVRKLYPDAELPTVETRQVDADTIEVVYRSPRFLAKLARGLIDGCIEHFGEAICVTETDSSAGAVQSVTFKLRRGG